MMDVGHRMIVGILRIVRVVLLDMDVSSQPMLALNIEKWIAFTAEVSASY